MDLTFQIPMQCFSLQHWTLLSQPDISTTEHCFHFGPAASFFLEILVIAFCSSKEKYYTAKTGPGDDCGLAHQFLIAKIRLKLKTVGKTTRPFRYDLNQILYDLTVEVTNRFKGLDLVDRVPEELWTEVCNIVQNHSKEK